MPRPHEDRQRHTPADHRPGGPAIVPVPLWWAIAVANVAAERIDAGTASYETLIEKARDSSAKVREAIVLRSHDRRRVIALSHLDGHEAFRHLSAAWDDHHLYAERRAVSESRSLSLYRLATSAGESAIDRLIDRRVCVRAPFTRYRGGPCRRTPDRRRGGIPRYVHLHR